MARSFLLAGCDLGMTGHLECQTYRFGHHAKLELGRIDVVSYSTRDLTAAMAAHNSFVL